jgi:succinate dehydrogenase / fumarate reductase iron-sulfur subunit
MQRTFKIYRFNPESDKKPYWKTYTVEATPGMTVLDGLHQIKWFQDGTLSFRRSCRSGICGSCAMCINGENGLACETQIANLKGIIKLEPLPGFKHIRDLVVDLDPFFAKLKEVKPYLINYTHPPAQERRQSPEERKVIDEAVNCILCGACTSSCPSYWYNEDYLGPAALYKAFRYIFDSRDEGKYERLHLLNDKQGLWRCHTIFNCVEACPKSLNPTQAIAELKKEIVKAAL